MTASEREALVAQRRRIVSETLRDKSFRLTWRDGAYYVSKPNIETQEVVSLADALDALAARDAEWRAAVERAKSRMAVCSACRNGSDAFDALLLEVPHDGQ